MPNLPQNYLRAHHGRLREAFPSWEQEALPDGGEADTEGPVLSRCVNLSRYLAAPCSEPGCAEQGTHVIDRSDNPAVIDITIHCEAHCLEHASAPPKEWPQEAPKDLVAEQENLF